MGYQTFILVLPVLLLMSRGADAICGAGLSSCGAACYDETVYDCLNGKLCPEAYLVCGEACYNPSLYYCDGGTLHQGTSPVQTCPTGSLICEIDQPVCRREDAVHLNTTRGVFESLHVDEIAQITQFLLADRTLNLTEFKRADIATNYIRWMELWVPEKSKVLSYLDSNGPHPGRWARVTIYNGGKQTPDVLELIVGPLPVTSATRWEELQLSYGKIPFVSRAYDIFEDVYVDNIVKNVTGVLEKVLTESFAATYAGCTLPSLCLRWNPTGPMGQSRTSWLWFMYDVIGGYLNAVPFDLLIAHNGTDPSKFYLVKIVYNLQSFSTAEELLRAYNENRVNKVTPTPQIFEKPLFSEFHAKSETYPRHQERVPPRHYDPQGKRFQVNNNQVQYMGWEFAFNSRPSSGLSLWDIRFKGERIVYELGLQESVTTYTGYSPSRSWAAYLDASWELGMMIYELKDGVDCPANSVYLDLVHYFYGVPVTFKNAICIFERDDSSPLIRHYNTDLKGGYFSYSGTPSYSLVVRTIATIYNYDFVYDYTFHLNGVIAVSVAASGYIQTNYYTAEEAPYSTKIRDTAAGQLHEHMVSFKVDLDIVGKENSFLVTTLEKELAQRPWFDEPIYQKKLVRRILQNESESGLRYNFTNPTLYSAINANAKNRWGVPKGYSIVVKDNFNDILQGTPVHRGFEWSKYNIAVTQRKDNEPWSSVVYNQATPDTPVLAFDSYFNGESLVQQDLVAWVTVGVLHLPHSEDIPITPVTTIGGHLSFLLKPNNYFDEDPSLDLKHHVVVVPGSNSSTPNVIEYEPMDNITQVCRPVVEFLPYDGWLR